MTLTASRIASVLFAIGSVAPCGLANASETAEEMVRYCQSVIAPNGGSASGTAYFAPTFETGKCWGAFSAIQQMGAIRETADQSPLLGFCIPEELRRTDVVRAFVSYVGQNPAKASSAFSVVAVLAFRARFPCTVPKS